MASGTAIAVGILSMAVVNTLMFAPDRQPRLVAQLAAIRRRVREYATPATQGLPNVDPVYTWVRLAQRVPVRIAIDNAPSDVPLVAGLAATVTIRDGKDAENERSCKESAPNSRGVSSD